MSPLSRVVFIVALLLAVAVPTLVLAQDVTLEPTQEALVTNTPSPTPTPVIVEPPPPDPVEEEPGDPPATTPENLLGQLFALLKDSTYIVWAAAGVLLIVGLIKIALNAVGITVQDNAAILLTLIVQVIVWLGYAVANYFGQGAVFQEWYLRIADVLRSLLPLAGAIFAGHVGYQAAKKRGVPILGYKPKPKTPKAA